MKSAAFFLGLFLSFGLIAQNNKDYAVLLTAEVKDNPVSITIHWPYDSVNSYVIYRKEKTQIAFPSGPMITLFGTATQFVDSSIQIGRSYEYYVKKIAATYTAHGYINSGIQVPAMHVKGKLILLIDSMQVAALETEIARLEYDLDVDGWSVIRKDISSNAKVSDIRNDLITEFNTDPQYVKAVFILGHVPVPYSGNIAPDGHPDHAGAWPCDGYYGEMNGGWGDNIVNTTTATESRNHNVPGDGKFDPSFMPSNVELQVGRVDFSNMPVFAKSETELLRAYLDKDHAYRTGSITAVPRALIDNNFGTYGGEAFSSTGWKAFSTMFGPDSIFESDYRNTLNNASYLWSYGCGGGSHTSASGIGTTANLATDSLQTIFTLMFGSYFGDWDRQDNFLRAPLAQGLTLTNAWSGRPHWYFHHMAMGENIGYSFLPAVNNGPYFTSYAGGYVHIALMGDPSLRMYVIQPPTGLNLSSNDGIVTLNWTASPENVSGYHVYRKQKLEENYTLVNNTPVATTSYSDNTIPASGTYYYCVRAVRLEETMSGTFFNLSSGVRDTVSTTVTVGWGEDQEENSMNIYPNPSKGLFQIALESDMEEMLVWMVNDVSGRKCVDGKQSLMAGYNRFDLDLTSLKDGLYVLTVHISKASFNQRIVISK